MSTILATLLGKVHLNSDTLVTVRHFDIVNPMVRPPHVNSVRTAEVGSYMRVI